MTSWINSRFSKFFRYLRDIWNLLPTTTWVIIIARRRIFLFPSKKLYKSKMWVFFNSFQSYFNHIVRLRCLGNKTLLFYDETFSRCIYNYYYYFNTLKLSHTHDKSIWRNLYILFIFNVIDGKLYKFCYFNYDDHISEVFYTQNLFVLVLSVPTINKSCY